MQTTEQLSFPDITPDRLDLIRARGKAQGLILDGSHGLSTWDGCGIDYTYDDAKNVLHITASVPFGISANEIEATNWRCRLRVKQTIARPANQIGIREF